jgi:glucose-6-phosphate dehydrogenase assembly protein OpcA
MRVDLPNTTTAKISKALVKIREEGGAVALGRVLTLVISTSHGSEEEAIEAANDASREHPMRVIVISTERGAVTTTTETARVDAEIRVGGDAGASEVVVLRVYGAAAEDEESLVTGLLLPDAPVVAWWPHDAPAVVSQSPLGRIAQRRITDSSTSSNPRMALQHLVAGPARRGARPAAVRARHAGGGVRRRRLPLHRAARRLARPAAAGAGAA